MIVSQGGPIMSVITRVVILLGCALALASTSACSCTMVGCAGAVTANIDGVVRPLETTAGLPISLHACYDSTCRDFTIHHQQGDAACLVAAGTEAPGVICTTPGNPITPITIIGAPGPNSGGTHRITVAIRSNTGADLVSRSVPVQMHSNSPNGKSCGPTCYSGSVTLAA